MEDAGPEGDEEQEIKETNSQQQPPFESLISIMNKNITEEEVANISGIPFRRSGQRHQFLEKMMESVHLNRVTNTGIYVSRSVFNFSFCKIITFTLVILCPVVAFLGNLSLSDRELRFFPPDKTNFLSDIHPTDKLTKLLCEEDAFINKNKSCNPNSGTISKAITPHPRSHLFRPILKELKYISPIHKLLNSDTPQGSALNWIVYHDQQNLLPNSTNLLQRWSLKVLYYELFPKETKAVIRSTRMREENNTMNNMTLNEEMLRWHELHECNWTFVRCGRYKPSSNDGVFPQENSSLLTQWSWENGYDIGNNENLIKIFMEPFYNTGGEDDLKVTGLMLENFGLAGEFVSEIGLLSHLRYVNMRDNSVRGQIPNEIYGLKQLEHLILEGNSLSGQIGEPISNLGGGLETLSLGRNKLVGTLPKALEMLTNIRILTLQENFLTGKFFNYLTNLRSIDFIRIESNQFTGSIPTEIGSFKSLRWLDISKTGISGTIPAEMANVNFLEGFISQKNRKISGTLPSEIVRCANLKYLDVRDCNIKGTIPKSYGKFQNLDSLILEYNNISGTLPTELGLLNPISILMLKHNVLQGTIPKTFGNMKSLRECYLNDNQINGKIPSELGRLEKIEALYLNHNDLKGTVPDELCSLPELRMFKVDCNGSNEYDYVLNQVTCPENCCNCVY